MDKDKEISRKSIGEYILKSATGNNESIDADGGALINRAIVAEIVDALKLESPIYNKCRKFTVGNGRGNGIKVPYSITSAANAASVGTRAYWVSEAEQKTISKPQLGQADMVFGKLVVRVPVTDELMADCSLLADFVIAEAVRAITYKIEDEIIKGVGTAIKGVAGDGDHASIVVDVDADITEADIKEFVDALNPVCYKRAEWYFAPQQWSVVCSINFTNETALAFDNGKYYLYGFPVNVIPQLTDDPYSVVLGDFSAYGIAIRGPSIRESSDIRFDYDETEIRICLRVAGSAICSTMALDDGNTYGFFVVSAGGEAGASSSSSSDSSSSSTSSSSESSESEGNNSSSSSVDSSSSTSNSSSSSIDSSSSSS
jgi:HK97 family phage major capsid protein